MVKKLLLLLANTLCIVVLLTKFLISQELRFHSPSRNIFDALLFFDAVRVCFVCVVVCTRVLLLLARGRKLERADER